VKVTNSVQSAGGLPGTAPKAAKVQTAPVATGAGDQVELSSLSARLQELGAKMGSSPVVDSARVAQIKQAIADGHFQVNPERIADGLLESARQMLGAGR
jgi:negative regulator of flagellin synthesis FlgM